MLKESGSVGSAVRGYEELRTETPYSMIIASWHPPIRINCVSGIMRLSADQMRKSRMIEYKDKRYVCALDLGFDIIRGKWKAVILCHLADGPKRFLALQRITHGVSQKVLTESLQQMEDEGLISKEVFPETPPRVEYSLTEKGSELVPALNVIEDWTRKYYPEAFDTQE